MTCGNDPSENNERYCDGKNCDKYLDEFNCSEESAKINLCTECFNLKMEDRMTEKGIRLTGTRLKNFAGFPAISVDYPEGTSYLCANNGGGKSTLTLTQIQACIKGIGEKNDGGNLIGSRFRFIGSSSSSADVINIFHDSREDRTFEIKNHITEGSNKITVKAGDDKPIRPEWLSDFLSISLMSEKHFCGLSSKDQAVALGIDTKPFDDRIKELKTEYTIINRAITAFGEIAVVEECLPVNIATLKESRKKIADSLNSIFIKNRKENSDKRTAYENERRSHDAAIAAIREDNRNREGVIVDCEGALTILIAHGYKGEEAKVFVESLQPPIPVHEFDKPEPDYINEVPDNHQLVNIDKQIEDAYETNASAEKYQAFVKRVAEKAAKVKELEDNKAAQKTESDARISYINQFDFGFSGLTTNEAGELQLNERPIKDPYFSTGERIKIVAKLMRSRAPLFKTVFLDSACELDPDNLKKLLDELVADGFHPIVSIPNEKPIDGEQCIVLRECKILNAEEGEKLI